MTNDNDTKRIMPITKTINALEGITLCLLAYHLFIAQLIEVCQYKKN